jgi:hypothetical protein
MPAAMIRASVRLVTFRCDTISAWTVAVAGLGLGQTAYAKDEPQEMPLELSAPTEEEDKERLKKEFAKMRENQVNMA